jgi:hypothetical protein
VGPPVIPANTTVAVYTGTTTNAYGDVTADNSTPAATGIPVDLVETSSLDMEASTQTPRSVRTAMADVAAGWAHHFTEDARVLDATGTWWVVDHVRQTPSAGAKITRIRLRGVTA